jgi:hypothetical protein
MQNSSKIIKIITIIIIILLTIFFIIILVESQSLDFVSNLFKKPKAVSVNDECSLIFNNLVHQIKNEGECKIRCRNECSLEKMNFYSVNFTAKSDSCNICSCYCK